MKATPADLSERIAALSRVVQLAPDDEAVAPARAVLARSAARRSLAPERTVVALAGGTGSGKSTLFNSLAGADLAPTGVRRPTTSRSRAAVWLRPGSEDGQGAAESEDADRLLDWLDIRDRHGVSGEPQLAGLVLVDLPDYDSTVAAHRSEAERMARIVDLLVWVVDPQKYADAALHDRYLRPLATHRDVMLLVLNQSDRLRPEDVQSCVRHLERLLEEDGLGGVAVLPTSATEGAGLAALREELSRRVGSTRAATARLHADLDAVVAQLDPLCESSNGRSNAGGATSRFISALDQAAGVPAAADAAAAGYRRDARMAGGWPPTRWVARLRRDPRRRVASAASELQLDRPSSVVPQARVANAVRDLVDVRTATLAPGWRAAVRSEVELLGADLPAVLGQAVRKVPLAAAQRPRWWATARSVQWVLLGIALTGALWLAALAVLAYLKLPDPSPHVGRAPVPTVLLIGGLVAGLLFSLILRPVIAARARRRRATVAESLTKAVRATADDVVLLPLDRQLGRQHEFCAALAHARRPRDQKRGRR